MVAGGCCGMLFAEASAPSSACLWFVVVLFRLVSTVLMRWHTNNKRNIKQTRGSVVVALRGAIGAPALMRYVAHSESKPSVSGCVVHKITSKSRQDESHEL